MSLAHLSGIFNTQTSFKSLSCKTYRFLEEFLADQWQRIPMGRLRKGASGISRAFTNHLLSTRRTRTDQQRYTKHGLNGAINISFSGFSIPLWLLGGLQAILHVIEAKSLAKSDSGTVFWRDPTKRDPFTM